MHDVMGGSVDAQRFNVTLLTVFGAVALALAAIGIYGVVAFAVARRTQESGIRVALGAKTRFGSPAAYGLAVSALAAGGLLGALTAGLLKISRRGLFLLGASAVISICVGALGFIGSVGAAAGVLAVMAASAAMTNIHLASWIQGRVDPAIRGRVLSVLMLAAIGLMPISLAAGFLAAWSLTGMFLVAGGAMLLVTIAGAARSSVRAIA